MVRQVLSDESLNDRGFRVMNKSIKWDRYLKNPAVKNCGIFLSLNPSLPATLWIQSYLIVHTREIDNLLRVVDIFLYI